MKNSKKDQKKEDGHIPVTNSSVHYKIMETVKPLSIHYKVMSTAKS
jgi:hypothetical protein